MDGSVYQPAYKHSPTLVNLLIPCRVACKLDHQCLSLLHCKNNNLTELTKTSYCMIYLYLYARIQPIAAWTLRLG